MEFMNGLFGINWIWCIVLLLGLIALFFIPFNDDNEKKETPLDVLHKNFAAGKLTVAEYEERKGVLDKR
jgi:putative membrane protein